jgi:hypothetical protein
MQLIAQSMGTLSTLLALSGVDAAQRPEMNKPYAWVAVA